MGGQDFTTKAKLNRPFLSFHEEKKPLKCEICVKDFQTQKSSKSAYFITSFKCDVCALGFSITCYLKSHIVSVHGGK